MQLVRSKQTMPTACLDSLLSFSRSPGCQRVDAVNSHFKKARLVSINN